MVASEHPEVIERTRQLIATDVLDSDEAAKYGSIDNDGTTSDEYDGSGLVESGLSTGVTEYGTTEMEEVQQDVKYYSL